MPTIRRPRKLRAMARITPEIIAAYRHAREVYDDGDATEE